MKQNYFFLVVALASLFSIVNASPKKATPDQTLRPNSYHLTTPLLFTQGYVNSNYIYFQNPKPVWTASDINSVSIQHCETNQNLVCFVIINTIDGSPDPVKLNSPPIVAVVGQWI